MPGQSKPTASSPTLHLPRVQQPRQGLGDVMEDAGAALLLELDGFPALAHPAGGVGHGVPEDVWMASYKLRVHGAGDGLEVALSLLFQELREEVRLEEKVAELVEELLRVVGVRCLGDLVCLLDRVRHDRACGLLSVPGAVAP